MRLLSIPMLGLLVAALTLSFVAAPLQAGNPYGGIGATVANFYAANPHGTGKPSTGMTCYRVGAIQGGRVIGFNVVVGWRSGYRAIGGPEAADRA